MRELSIASAPAAIALARIIPAFFSQKEISLPDDSAAARQISVAIVSTQIPVLLGHGFWGFSLMKLPRYGFWSMMHEARTDFSIWLEPRFPRIAGAGP